MDLPLKHPPRELDKKTTAGNLQAEASHWDVHANLGAEQASLLLRAVVNSADDAIISKDLNGVVTSWNPAAERMFGYSAKEIVGKSITMIIPPDLLHDEPIILGKIKAGEAIEHFQTTRLRKDSTRIHVSLSVSPIRDRDGRVVGAAKIARDITQQSLDEQAARRLAAIVESSDDAIVSKDLNGIVTSWNQAAERMFGYSAAEIVGRPIMTIIPPELHGDEPVILGKIRAGERIEHFETVRLHKSGSRLDVSLTISPIRRGGEVVGAAKIARDVTHQRRMEAALHISERLASVGRLAATIAHEINNPLEAVTNFIYLARQNPDLPENVQEYLRIADHELARVAHVAQQTLGFYRDNTRPVDVAISKAIEDVLVIFGSKLKYKCLTVQTRIPPGLQTHTLQGQLKQILLNLIGNSIDASKQDGQLIITAHVVGGIHAGRKVLVMTVADNGSGIPQANRAKIFEPFFTTKKDVGTGLGLWITRDLLEKKGGHIRFRSRTGENSGTAMSIFLPEEPAPENKESAA